MTTSVDVINRALQKLGAKRIVSHLDNSKNASETTGCYDSLRRAELRRNVWRFAIRRAMLRAATPTTLKLAPATFDLTITYPAYAIVFYAFNGLTYVSLADFNLGNAPDVNPALWTIYYGPLTADVFDSGTTYDMGELVYTPATAGSYAVFSSLADENDTTPSTTPPTYDATVTYGQGDFVVSSAVTYESLVDLNINFTPATSPDQWLSFNTSGAAAYAGGTTYAAGAIVSSGGLFYESRASANTGNTPASSPTWWRLIPTQTTRALGTWLKLDSSVSKIINPSNLYPDKNVYTLPNGFIREAAQNPKAGSNSVLGAPSNAVYDDWLLEGDYLITEDVGPITFRFAADVVDPNKFDPMFLEGFACRIALEVCEALTQSTAKMTQIQGQYKNFMTEARAVNGIEVGSEEPPLDDYIATRA